TRSRWCSRAIGRAAPSIPRCSRGPSSSAGSLIRWNAGPRRKGRDEQEGRDMKVGAAIAEIMKREGVEILCAYPVNHLIEHAAALDIRPIIVRQERIGLHMADAI